MSKWCVTFKLHLDNGKVKIDYGCVPAIYSKYFDKTWYFNSEISNEVFELRKKEFEGYTLYYNFTKEKDEILFQGIFDSAEENLLDYEARFLPIIERFIKKKILFNFKYKQALKDRVDRILETFKY